MQSGRPELALQRLVRSHVKLTTEVGASAFTSAPCKTVSTSVSASVPASQCLTLSLTKRVGPGIYSTDVLAMPAFSDIDGSKRGPWPKKPVNGRRIS